MQKTGNVKVAQVIVIVVQAIQTVKCVQQLFFCIMIRAIIHALSEPILWIQIAKIVLINVRTVLMGPLVQNVFLRMFCLGRVSVWTIALIHTTT